MDHLKGEALNVDLDGGIKLEFHGAKVTINIKDISRDTVLNQSFTILVQCGYKYYKKKKRRGVSA